MITTTQLVEIYGCTLERANHFALPLTLAMLAHDITTPERIAAFLAQVGHESGRLRYVREIWNPEQCPWQARYEGREDLGNVFPGDGSKFRGRGLIQITGRANYTACGTALNLPLTEHPELLEQPLYAASSAAWYWDTHNLNKLADSGDFARITQKINGGLNGYEARLQLWSKAKSILGC